MSPIPSPRRPVWRAAALALLVASGAALAEPDAPAQREIDHLLEFVGTSNCTFLRGTSSYSAADARDHLAMKYRYARSRLATADDFVKHLATRSSSDGEPYRIVCNRQEQMAGAWLSDELKRFRTKASAGR